MYVSKKKYTSQQDNKKNVCLQEKCMSLGDNKKEKQFAAAS